MIEVIIIKTHSPQIFKNHFSYETSAHFINLIPLMTYIDQNRVGVLDPNTSKFITEPLRFYERLKVFRYDCSSDKKISVSYCYKNDFCTIDYFIITSL